MEAGNLIYLVCMRNGWAAYQDSGQLKEGKKTEMTLNLFVGQKVIVLVSTEISTGTTYLFVHTRIHCIWVHINTLIKTKDFIIFYEYI